MNITFKALQSLLLVLCALVLLPRPGAAQGAGTDAYGGSTRVRWEATGSFRLQQNGGRFWLVTPEGHPFFNLGIIRPAPACPWWRLVWSLRSSVLVGDDGKVPVRSLRLSIDSPPRSRVVKCQLFDGDIFFLKSHTKTGAKPFVLLHSPPF